MNIDRQTLAEMGGPLSVLSLQRRDHIKLDNLLHQLERTVATQQDATLRRIYRLVFRHAFAEEAVLWPVIRRSVPDGEQLTLQVEQEHQKINEQVTRLEGLQPGSAEYATLLSKVVDLLRQDVRDEEEELFVKLKSRLSSAKLRWVGVAWYAVRKIAPTRAHPIVARRPPGNVLSALPLSVIDRLRDLTDSALQRGVRPASALRRLSARLTKVAHAAEAAPGLRSGEHPSTRRDPGVTRKRLVISGLARALFATSLSPLWRGRHAT
jgi:hemerythrin-like domain-containing protein